MHTAKPLKRIPALVSLGKSQQDYEMCHGFQGPCSSFGFCRLHQDIVLSVHGTHGHLMATWHIGAQQQSFTTSDQGLAFGFLSRMSCCLPHHGGSQWCAHPQEGQEHLLVGMTFNDLRGRRVGRTGETMLQTMITCSESPRELDTEQGTCRSSVFWLIFEH